MGNPSLHIWKPYQHSLQKGYKMRDKRLIKIFLLSLFSSIIIIGCKDKKTESEQISGSKIREFVKIFVSEGNKHQETNSEADTMPPVVPHPDSHHINWSWSLFTPTLRGLVAIGEPSVPYLLEEYKNNDKENKPFTVKSAGWAIIHIGEPALSGIEKAIQTGNEEERLGLTIIISAIADYSKSQKAVDMLKGLQKDESKKVRDMAIDLVIEHQK
jgi:hypothetical protein